MPMCLGPCRIVNLSLPSSPTLLPSGEGRLEIPPLPLGETRLEIPPLPLGEARLGISPLPLGETRLEISPLPLGEGRLEIPPLPCGAGLWARQQPLRYPPRPSHCRHSSSRGRDQCA